jgi:hypothetical protein
VNRNLTLFVLLAVGAILVTHALWTRYKFERDSERLEKVQSDSAREFKRIELDADRLFQKALAGTQSRPSAEASTTSTKP